MPLIYKLQIEGPYSPETLPMARLARYMIDLATLLGESKHVRFSALEGGSVTLAVEVASDAAPKVNERVAALKQGEASPGLRRAYATLCNHLAQDQATAKLFPPRNQGRPALALRFPGQSKPGEAGTAAKVDSDQAFANFRLKSERKPLQGYLLAVGGPKDNPRLTVDGLGRGHYWTCIRTSQGKAQEIAKHLYRPVRLHGTSDWLRDTHGEWHLKGFQMERFELLRDTPLDELTEELRAIKGSGWLKMDDPDAFLRELRYGPDPKEP